MTMISDDLKAILTSGTRERKGRGRVPEFLSLLLGNDPPPEVTILRPDGDVFGSFVAPKLRKRLVTLEQLAELDRRHEAPAIPRQFTRWEA